MEKLIIEHTEDTPKVHFEPEIGIFSIEGRSLPENAVAFYNPILEWLKQYENTENKGFTFDFKLDYFNTASAKQITKLLIQLQQMTQKFDIKVNWHYYVEDADIMASGLRFAKLIKANIELLPYE
ncbi:MAG: nuclear pore complex subunit [Bacteroidetes bacterium HGW-Bacteroidetes-4]|jgi:hypothetical protein|nr:MAG: nuclear pore complex subunit [Bacteroidetes bacterium HGW-Bacteroidetes-4]